jgi:hypothetical protein
MIYISIDMLLCMTFATHIIPKLTTIVTFNLAIPVAIQSNNQWYV